MIMKKMKQASDKATVNIRIIFIVILGVIMFMGIGAQIADYKLQSQKTIGTIEQEYAKNGFPVFASKIVRSNTDFFATISIEKSGNRYLSYIDKTLESSVVVGSLVVLMIDNVTYYGKVVSKSSVINLDYGAYPIYITFNKSVPFVKNFYQARVSVANLRNIIAVNNDNIGFNDKGSFVWVINSKGEFEQKYVKTGIKDGFKTEIKSGLKAGDILVVSDFKSLHEGGKARVIPAYNSAN